MLLPTFITKLYAPDDKQTGIELAEDDLPPQEDADKKETTPDKGKDGEDGSETHDEPKGGKEELVDIEGLEQREDGRYEFTVGDSVYISKEGLKDAAAVSDVLAQWRKGSIEKDKSIKTLREKSAKEKAVAAIRIPQDDDEDKAPPLPQEREIIAGALQKHGLQVGMDTWDDSKWLAYQEQHELKDWQIAKLQRAVEVAQTEAAKSAEIYLKNFNNHKALKEAEQSVQDVLSEVDGVEPSDYAGDFADVVRRARKDGLNAYGEISSTWIVKEFTKVIAKTLTQRQKSQLQQQTEREIAENKERRKGVKPPVTGAKGFKPKGAEYKSIHQATTDILKEWREKQGG